MTQTARSASGSRNGAPPRRATMSATSRAKRAEPWRASWATTTRGVLTPASASQATSPAATQRATRRFMRRGPAPRGARSPDVPNASHPSTRSADAAAVAGGHHRLQLGPGGRIGIGRRPAPGAGHQHRIDPSALSDGVGSAPGTVTQSGRLGTGRVPMGGSTREEGPHDWLGHHHRRAHRRRRSPGAGAPRASPSTATDLPHRRGAPPAGGRRRRAPHPVVAALGARCLGARPGHRRRGCGRHHPLEGLATGSRRARAVRAGRPPQRGGPIDHVVVLTPTRTHHRRLRGGRARGAPHAPHRPATARPWSRRSSGPAR